MLLTMSIGLQIVIAILLFAVTAYFLFYRIRRRKNEDLYDYQSTNEIKWKPEEFNALKEINKYRKKNGLTELLPDDNCYRQAGQRSIEHSQIPDKDWKAQGHELYGLHANRLRALGFKSVSENLGRGHKTGFHIVRSWKNSPTHRAILKNDKLTHCGIAFYKRKDTQTLRYKWFWTFIGGRL